MKDYPSICGWKHAPKGLPCVAFEKPDGSQIRAEYHKKRGWGKYGSRNVLLGADHEHLGSAIALFEQTLAEPILKVFRENKKMPEFDEATVYMEFHGPSSAFGQHVAGEPKTLTLFDVNLTKRGFVLPRDFVKWFGHLETPKVLYEGNFNSSFIADVRNGIYGTGEGVVVKGIKDGAKSEQHRLWTAKVKTNAWMEKLRAKAAVDPTLVKLLEENVREQDEV